jgi:hypothetical protein
VTTWVEIELSEVPAGARFLVAPSDQGQAIEVAYATFGSTYNDDSDAPFKAVTDRSVGPVPRYYRAVRS